MHNLLLKSLATKVNLVNVKFLVLLIFLQQIVDLGIVPLMPNGSSLILRFKVILNQEH